MEKESRIYLRLRYSPHSQCVALDNQTQLIVVAPPKFLGPKRWEYKVQMVSNSGATPSVEYLKAGKTTRFRSNYHPELSVRGYVKYQYNTETHRRLTQAA